MEEVKEAEMLRAYRVYGNSKLLCGKGDFIFNMEKFLTTWRRKH